VKGLLLALCLAGCESLKDKVGVGPVDHDVQLAPGACDAPDTDQASVAFGSSARVCVRLSSALESSEWKRVAPKVTLHATNAILTDPRTLETVQPAEGASSLDRVSLSVTGDSDAIEFEVRALMPGEVQLVAESHGKSAQGAVMFAKPPAQEATGLSLNVADDRTYALGEPVRITVELGSPPTEDAVDRVVTLGVDTGHFIVPGGGSETRTLPLSLTDGERDEVYVTSTAPQWITVVAQVGEREDTVSIEFVGPPAE
jgi:hypothetical protein